MGSFYRVNHGPKHYLLSAFLFFSTSAPAISCFRRHNCQLVSKSIHELPRLTALATIAKRPVALAEITSCCHGWRWFESEFRTPAGSSYKVSDMETIGLGNVSGIASAAARRDG